jgi:hypothetical protein
MLLSAPPFKDRTGWLPFLNLEYVFLQLTEGLAQNRTRLGEQRYQVLTRMAVEIRPLFEADPENKTGETLQGRKIILQMEDILREIKPKG